MVKGKHRNALEYSDFIIGLEDNLYQYTNLYNR
jgi:hypothetical protein